MSSSKQQTQSSQQSWQAPWDVQAPYLSQAFQSAWDAYQKAQGAQAPTNFTAQYSPDQISAFSNMQKYGMGNAAIPGSSAAAGERLSNSGSLAAARGLSDLAAFRPAGGTGANIDAANQYVRGENIPALVDADMLSARRQVSEGALPQIARAAAAGGNVNSSRSAIANGIVERGLAEQAGALGAQLQSSAYNGGLSLAEQNYENQNSNMLSKMLGLASSGTNAAMAGVGANSAAVGQRAGLFDIANQGIQGQYAAAQAPLTNRLQQWLSATNSPFAALNNFYNIIGNRSWGSQSSSTGQSDTTSTPSWLQTIGGLLSGGGGFFKQSDRRLKKDIEHIGELFNGLPVYRFRYRDDPTNTLYIGLMAQDVEQETPEAVIEVGGFKAVNYDLATLSAIVE